MSAVLADDLARVVQSVDGVAALYARPGFSTLARRVVDSVTKTSSPVTVVQTSARTRVEIDVAVAEGRSGPAVARTVAAAVLDHLAEVGAPTPSVDVRVVALG